MTYLYAATLVFFLLFFISYKHNRASLAPGFLFCVFFCLAGLSYALFALQTGIALLEYSLVFIAFLLLLVLSFGLYGLIAFLLLNARLVYRRERRSLQNSLTLLLGLALLAFTVLSFFIGRLPTWVRCLWSGFLCVIIYYFFHIFVFLTSCWLCTLSRPRLRQQYIIVLGSGLVNGGVPPLLAARINRAIAFYQRQKGKNRQPPKLVLTGGQGSDEATSEAEAMRQYALEEGIPSDDLIAEKSAKNTAENFSLSKTLMDRDAANTPYRCTFATSSYHLLRAGLYARKAGLPAAGLGAKTALYYLPNALLREYIALIALHKVRYVVVAVLAFLFGIFLNLFPRIMAPFILT